MLPLALKIKARFFLLPLLSEMRIGYFVCFFFLASSFRCCYFICQQNTISPLPGCVCNWKIYKVMNQEAMKISNSLVLRAIDACTQGNCKALMLSIERLLGVLHVKHLVLSAAEGAEDIWLTKFGFNQISNLQVCCAFYHILIDGFLHRWGRCFFFLIVTFLLQKLIIIFSGWAFGFVGFAAPETHIQCANDDVLWFFHSWEGHNAVGH